MKATYLALLFLATPMYSLPVKRSLCWTPEYQLPQGGQCNSIPYGRIPNEDRDSMSSVMSDVPMTDADPSYYGNEQENNEILVVHMGTIHRT
ncbi:hypothetical protein V8C42DRAFT_322180 [Trichoderma barbatum]